MPFISVTYDGYRSAIPHSAVSRLSYKVEGASELRLYLDGENAVWIPIVSGTAEQAFNDVANAMKYECNVDLTPYTLPAPPTEQTCPQEPKYDDLVLRTPKCPPMCSCTNGCREHGIRITYGPARFIG